MTTSPDLTSDRSSVHEVPGQGDRGHPPPAVFTPPAWTVAISRETGARGGSIAKRLSKKLGWSYYDQELLHYLASGSRLEDEIITSLSPEAREWIGEQFAQLQAENRLLKDPKEQDVAQVILAIAAKGKAVILGRGAGAILPAYTVLHVRIMAPLEDRVAWIRQIQRLTREQALEYIQKQDKQRAGMLDAHYRKSVRDTIPYDLMLNSSRLGEVGCGAIIAEAVRQKQG